jgi:hypothetical protein
MPLLNQILAIEKGTKSKAEQELTRAYHQLQKPDLLAGISKTYQPKDEEGDQLPPESKRVQMKAEELLRQVSGYIAELFDVTLTKDVANCGAKADLVVDGQTLLKDVPVTTLLFLEKKLVDIHTFVSKLPTLDPAYDWHYDTAQDCWATEPRQTHRTQKIQRPLVLAPATDKHPAQVQLVTEDVIAGNWTTIGFSGAMQSQRVNQIVARVEKLQAAIKMAREAANSIEAPKQEMGKPIFDYLFSE